MSSDHRVSPDSDESSSHEAAREGREGDRPSSDPPPSSAGPTGNSSGRPGRKVVVLAIALVVLAVAGFSIAKSLREADWLLAAVPRARALGVGAGTPAGARVDPPPVPSDSSEDPSERCQLQVFSDEPGGETVVVLTPPGKMTEFRQGVVGNHSRLAREIVRQAVLLAAREELNLTVRDAAIGDPSPKGRPAIVIDVAVLCPREKTSIRLSRGEGARREVLFERTLRNHEKLNDHLTLLREAELASRDALPGVFKKAGIKGKGGPKPGNGGLPTGVEDRLLKMSFVSQFAALRQLHQVTRSDGLSPWRLHGLARGYANLGVLTEFQWDAASQAYKARGLLYAQRDVAARPGAPVARWNRAYAAAMAGTHRIALNDLDAASRFAKAMAEATRPAPPPWVDLIEAHCRSDVKKFAEPRTDTLAGLESFLYMKTVEYPSNTDVALNAAREAIDAEPECFRAHDALCEVGGVANLHRATTAAPEILDTVTPLRIADLPGVPEPVREAAQHGRNEVKMTLALDEAAGSTGDNAEPSWGALAKIVRETRFVHTFRRLYFMAKWWNVPTDDYWEEVRPFVANHRFRPFLETYVRGVQVAPELVAWIVNLDTTDLGLNASAMTLMFRNVKIGDANRPLYAISATLCDWTAHDLSIALNLHRSTQPEAVDYAHKLLSVSPNSAFAMGILVESAWEEAGPKVEGWRKTVGDHPSLIGPLARRYNDLGRLVDADALLKRYIELSPDPWAYQMLANRAKSLGDEARWKSILDEYLAKVEDHGLDHAKIRVEIANTLMATGRYDEARPYADAAAETWAGWAMQTAQRCAEGQEDWKAAEKWAQARAVRYPSSAAYDWLEFCERTGQGQLTLARDATLEYLDRLGDQADGQTVIPRASLLMMGGDYGKTFDPLQRLIKAEAEKADNAAGHQGSLVTLLAAAGQAGDRKLLDSTAEQFIGQYATVSPRFTGILTKIREAIAKGGPEAFDRDGVDKLIGETPETNRAGPALVVASYLAGCDQHDKAKPYWEQAADKSQVFFWYRLIAASKLRQRYR